MALHRSLSLKSLNHTSLTVKSTNHTALRGIRSLLMLTNLEEGGVFALVALTALEAREDGLGVQTSCLGSHCDRLAIKGWRVQDQKSWKKNKITN